MSSGCIRSLEQGFPKLLRPAVNLKSALFYEFLGLLLYKPHETATTLEHRFEVN